MTTSLPVFLGRLIGLAAVSMTLLTGCGKQGEGERCSTLNANQDCEGGLVCVAGSELRSSDDVSRCCPSDPGAASDSRCTRLSGGGGIDEPVGGGGEGGEAAMSLQCDHDSECPLGMKCGPTGACIVQCLTDRDCDVGEACTSEGACAPAMSGSGGAE